MTNYPREQMHRIAYTALTQGQIGDKLRAAADGPTSASELADILVGRQLRIVTDKGHHRTPAADKGRRR